MSLAFQSWEAASGLYIGYTFGTQTNHCCVDGSNYEINPQQSTIIRGLSTLSLYAPTHIETGSLAKGSGDHCELALPNEQSLSSVPTPRLTSCSLEGSKVCVDEHALSNATRLMSKSAGKASLTDDSRRFGRSHALLDSHTNSYQNQKLDVVSEDRPWDNRPMMDDLLEPDTISSSSSVSMTAGESVCSSGCASHIEDDIEVQSSFQGHLHRTSSPEASLPVRKGLSRFYSGKSQSFSCLAGVNSARDLAKPENPYSKKRKNLQPGNCTPDRPPLHPLRNGAVGISKKSVHNSKYVLALAVAISTREGLLGTHQEDFRASQRVSRSNSNTAPVRSFSLSDLQWAGNHLSPQ